MFASVRILVRHVIIGLIYLIAPASHGADIQGELARNMPFMSVDLIVKLGWSANASYNFLVETSGYVRQLPESKRLFICQSMDDVWYWDCLSLSVEPSVLRAGLEFELDKCYQLKGVVGRNSRISRVNIDLWKIQSGCDEPDTTERPKEIDAELPPCAVNDAASIAGGMYPLSVLAAGPTAIRNKRISTAGYLARGMNTFICRTKQFRDCVRLCGDTGQFESGRKIFVSGVFVESEAPALILTGTPVSVVPRKWFFQ